MAFRLVCVVGIVETHGMHEHETLRAAIEEGDSWLGDQEHEIQCQLDAGNYVAAEVPTYYVVEDTSTDETVHRSNAWS